MRSVVSTGLLGALLASMACGGFHPVAARAPVVATPRRTVVWLDASGLDQDTAARLQAAGVDLVVQPRGTVTLTSDAPVLRLNRPGAVAGSIPVGVMLRVESKVEEIDSHVAVALWREILKDRDGEVPAELVLDVPTLSAGMSDFLEKLAQAAGIPVVPVLTVEQIKDPRGVEIVTKTGSCIVPCYGPDSRVLRGLDEAQSLPLADRLAPLAFAQARVRVAVSLQPQCQPALAAWGDDLGLVVENDLGEVSTSSVLDRTLVFKRSVQWSGREWTTGDQLAVRWFDAARLNSALGEMHRLSLPELGGWDLVSLPPAAYSLGIGREALVKYFLGEGPAPEVVLSADRRGQELKVTLANRSPFTSAVSGFGNWLDVSVRAGFLVVEDRGAFDRVVLGTRKGGRWEASTTTGVDTVRFVESFIGPNEVLETGVLRLPSERSGVTVRWNIVLSTGEEISGHAQL
jgi:hypothetical protein